MDPRVGIDRHSGTGGRVLTLEDENCQKGLKF